MRKNRTSLFDKKENTFHRTEFNSIQENYSHYFDVIRTDSSIELKFGQIIRCDKNAVSVFGGIENKPFLSLFADRGAGIVKLSELERNQTCVAYLVDGDGRRFWARITIKENKVLISDIQREKSFLSDGEDLRESMERSLYTKEERSVLYKRPDINSSALFCADPLH